MSGTADIDWSQQLIDNRGAGVKVLEQTPRKQ